MMEKPDMPELQPQDLVDRLRDMTVDQRVQVYKLLSRQLPLSERFGLSGMLLASIEQTTLPPRIKAWCNTACAMTHASINQLEDLLDLD